MTIGELFKDLGLSVSMVTQMLSDIQAYNERNPNNRIPKIDLNASKEKLMMSQTPFLGRALGKERGREYLDDENLFPLTKDENAMRYAALEMDRYYRKDQ
jgi:hypothetical protein